MKKGNTRKETVRMALDIAYVEEFGRFMEREARKMLLGIGNPWMSAVRRQTGEYDSHTISLLVFTETQGLAGELLIELKGVNPYSETYDVDISWIPEPDSDTLQIRRRMVALIYRLKEKWAAHYHKMKKLNMKKSAYSLFLFLGLSVFICSLVSGQQTAVVILSGIPAAYCTAMLVRTLLEQRKIEDNE